MFYDFLTYTLYICRIITIIFYIKSHYYDYTFAFIVIKPELCTEH